MTQGHFLRVIELVLILCSFYRLVVACKLELCLLYNLPIAGRDGFLNEKNKLHPPGSWVFQIHFLYNNRLATHLHTNIAY